MGIFPFLPVGTVNEELASQLATAFAAEVELRQGSAWKIYSHRDIFSFINEAGLGRGYKHLQADLNSSGSGQVVFTAETKEFLKALKAKFGVDGFLIGSYKYGVTTQPKINIFTGQAMFDSRGQPMLENVPVLSARSTLYSANSERFWWYGVITRKGNVGPVVDALAKSLAQHIGQGPVCNM